MTEKRTVLCELKQNSQYQDASKSSIEKQHGLVAIQLENSIDVLSIAQSSIANGVDSSLAVSSRVSSHSFDHDTGDRPPTVSLSSGSGNLGVYKISGTQTRCTTELHHLTLKGLIREQGKSSQDISVKDCQILGFCAGKLTVLVDSHLVVQLVVNETKPWEIVYTIECPSKVLHASATGNILAVVDSDHSILFHDLVTSNFLAVVQREKGNNWTECRMTPDCLHLVLQNENGEIFCCNLDLYFQQNSLLVNRDHSSPHGKSGAGASHWFDKLQFSARKDIKPSDRKFKSSKSLFKISMNGDCIAYQCTEDHIAAITLQKGKMVLNSYSLITGDSETLNLRTDEYVILSDVETIPHMILSANKVYAATIGHFKIHYSQAEVKKNLLRSVIIKNGWGSEPAPTIEKLAQALQNRDINTALEFIKSRYTFIDDVMSSPPVGSREDLERLCSIISTAASTYISHSTTHVFATQLTEAILAFLQAQTRKGMVMLREMLISEEVEKRELLESLLGRLSDHDITFKEILKSSPKKSSSSSKKLKKSETSKALLASVTKELPALTKDVIKKWNSLSTKELIGDGILMGDISLLQGYFRLHSRESEASWDYIVKIGLQCVLDELIERNWSSACQMLKNMGFGVFTKLSQIAMYTTDSNLRKYLVEELKSEGEFTESDQKAIEFAAEIDKLYPCESFQQSLAIGRSGGFSNFPTSDVFGLSKLCGEIGVISPGSDKSRWYSHYMLDWVNYWIPHQHDIHIERIIHDQERYDELSEIPAVSLWSYLCRHNMIDKLLLWIDVQCNKATAEHTYQSQPITTEMIDVCCAILPTTNKMAVLDKLAVQGIVDSETQSTIQGRFSTLCRTGLITNRSEAEKLLTLEEFISYCLKHSLHEIISHHFKIWGIEESEVKRLDSKLSGKDYLLLIMLYSFHKLSSNPADSGLILDASLASSRYLTRNPYLTWAELMDKQLTDVALCGVMYHNPILETSSVPLPQDKITLYKDHTLFKHLLNQEGDSSNPDEITLYTLLKKWGVSSGDRLFSFQSSKSNNQEQPKDTDGMMTEMPHFSSETMVRKYGHEEKLTFLHYLKEGRPCFAYIVFLSDELSANNGSTISGARINLAVSQTHYLAVKYYNKLEICASCVAFLELIREETDKLRLLVNTAQIIHRGRALQPRAADTKVIHYEIESMILPLIFSRKKTIRIVYDDLVEATEACLDNQETPSTSLEAGMKWRTAIDYSRHYNLQLPTKFLECCSKENNWLSFLVYAQIFNYERIQLLSMVNTYADDSIREHLQCVLDSTNSANAAQAQTQESRQQSKREQIYFKMGLGINPRNAKDSQVLVSSSEDETRKNLKEKQLLVERQSSTKPSTSTNSNFSDVGVGGIPLEHVPNDIFAVLFMTNNHPGSWRQLNIYAVLLENPVLAVLAACHKESDALECLSSYLIAWLPDSSRLGRECIDMDTGHYHSKNTHAEVIQMMANHQKYYLLRTALHIFLKNCPLILLIDAIELVQKQDFIGVSKKLTCFKETMNLLFRQSKQTRTGGENFSPEELSAASLHIMQTCLPWFDSFLCKRFLNLLDNASLFTVFKHQNINFGHAHQVYNVVYEQRLEGIDRSRLISPHCLDEAKSVIQTLQSKKEFGIARELCVACGLDTGLVSVQELLSDTEQAKYNTSWQKSTNHSEFWAKCNDKCVSLDLDAKKCSAFFESQAGLSTGLEDKITLSLYALTWIKQHSSAHETGDIKRLQKLVWESRINHLLELQSQKGYEPHSVQASAYPQRPKVSVSIDKTQFLLLDYKYEDLLNFKSKSQQSKMRGAVSDLIGELLDDFKIDEACQLSVEYGCSTLDLVVILVCIGLAMKSLRHEQLDLRVKAMIGEGEVKKRRSSSVSQGYLLALSSVEDFAAMSKPVTTRSDSCLDVLEKLAHRCVHGAVACDKIVCCYIIAMALGQSYKETILQSEYSLLKQLLSSQVEDKFKLTLEYINTCSLSDSDIGSFLASNVTNTLRVIVGLDDEMIGTVGDLQMTGSTEECIKVGREYKQLIQLFTDQTIFGFALLEQANNLTIDEPEAEMKLAVKVELLILAHDAHTCAYDMEGISAVLRACRACAIQMNEVSSYTLMIHMLTGIGRFSEMTYIFDSLKQNHRFELLFRKGMPKENKLRLAVLDYLRRFCPGDNDIYRVVSSHFAMYREIAQLLEESALKKLNEINLSTARSSDLLSSMLTDIQKNLTDAAEIYMEGQCLRHAQNCVKQARLVYLQIHLISAGIPVINLEPQQVRSFIETHDKFHEVFIVSEAYNKSTWATALCNNVLVRGDMKYLTDYKKSLPLNTSLITEIIQRFQIKSEVARTQHINNNLRRLLSYCKDVVIRYKLARSLDLKDVTNELLTMENGLVGAVIKDAYGNNSKANK